MHSSQSPRTTSRLLWPVVVGVAVFFSFLLFCLSFDTLEYYETGLNYSWISEVVAGEPYSAGRYYLGLGNHFIKFPKTVQSIFFVDSWSTEALTVHGPPLESRTKDGLNIKIEVSFQYKLQFSQVFKLFSTIGPIYEPMFVRMAIEQLSEATTRHNAADFFQHRTKISEEMKDQLDAHFLENAFATVPFFQLRTVHLPQEFEESIQNTQVKRQDIEIAKWEQASMNVSFDTRVIQAQKAIQVIGIEAEGEALVILLHNDAFCRQYGITQQLQAEALKRVKDTTNWNVAEMLDYLRIRAVRAHPSERTTVRL